MTTGFGEPGEWNGQHFKSPSILDFGDYLLMAMEGWRDTTAPSGIGLMIGVERWLKSKQETVVFEPSGGAVRQATEIKLGNYGAGNLMITDIVVSGPQFTVDAPSLPFSLKSSKEITIPVHYEPGGNPVTGTLTILSDAQIGNRLVIDLVGY